MTAATATTRAPLTCKMCDRPFAAEDISREVGCAFCQTCNTVRDLGTEALLPAKVESPESVKLPAAPPPQRSRPAMPASLELVEGGETRQLRWRRSIAAPLGGLLSWAAAPALVLAKVCQHAERSWDWALEMLVGLPRVLLELDSPIMKAVAVSWFALGLALAYLVWANAKNFTTLEVSGGKVAVRQGPWPVPWRRAVTLQWSDIAQLFCRRYPTSRNGDSFYAVEAQLKQGKAEVRLVDTLETPDQALYLEAWLEQLLDIRDVPVRGEFRKAKP